MNNDSFVRDFITGPTLLKSDSGDKISCTKACNSLSTQGNVLNSYSTVIALKLIDNGKEFLVVDIDAYYSNTTSKHICLVKRHAWRKYESNAIVNISYLNKFIVNGIVKTLDKRGVIDELTTRVKSCESLDKYEYCHDYKREAVAVLLSRITSVLDLIPEVADLIPRVEAVLSIFNTDEKLSKLRREKDSALRKKKEENAKICMGVLKNSKDVIFDVMCANSYFSRCKYGVVPSEFVTKTGESISNMNFNDMYTVFKAIGYSLSWHGGAGSSTISDVSVYLQEISDSRYRCSHSCIAIKLVELNNHYTDTGFNFDTSWRVSTSSYSGNNVVRPSISKDGYVFDFQENYASAFNMPSSLIDLLHNYITTLRELNVFDCD